MCTNYGKRLLNVAVSSLALGLMQFDWTCQNVGNEHREEKEEKKKLILEMK